MVCLGDRLADQGVSLQMIPLTRGIVPRPPRRQYRSVPNNQRNVCSLITYKTRLPFLLYATRR